MSAAARPLPPFGEVAAALRRTTERLAREVVLPTAQPPDWSDFDWEAARAVAAMQGITVLLAHRLRWQGPPRWQDFLATQQRRALERDARIATLVERIDVALQTAGVRAVGLKGTALRRLTLYRSGERPMGDVDLLARASDRARITRALRSLDYAMAFETRRHCVFAPPQRDAASAHGEHPDNPLKIELHEAIAESLPVRSVDITAALFPDSPARGLVPYRDEVELMRHLLLHAATNMRAHALRQVQLHDIALLAPRLAAGDWDKLLATPQSRGGCWWMYPPLALCLRYYPQDTRVPLAEFARACPRVLRMATRRETLTSVSWSNLRIHAFPGMCWSRTPLDALRYARQRALPDRSALQELSLAENAQPALRQIPWYGLGHARRMLRWLVSRPPRVQTLVSLRAALDERGGGV